MEEDGLHILPENMCVNVSESVSFVGGQVRVVAVLSDQGRYASESGSQKRLDTERTTSKT